MKHHKIRLGANLQGMCSHQINQHMNRPWLENTAKGSVLSYFHGPALKCFGETVVNAIMSYFLSYRIISCGACFKECCPKIDGSVASPTIPVLLLWYFVDGALQLQAALIVEVPAKASDWQVTCGTYILYSLKMFVFSLSWSEQQSKA